MKGFVSVAFVVAMALAVTGCSTSSQPATSPSQVPTQPSPNATAPAPYVPPTFQPGQRECGTTGIRAQGLYQLENCYVVATDKALGFGVRRSDPKQGIIIVAYNNENVQKEFKTPSATGPTKLLSIDGATVLFSTQNGEVGKFDLKTESFVTP